MVPGWACVYAQGAMEGLVRLQLNPNNKYGSWQLKSTLCMPPGALFWCVVLASRGCLIKNIS